MPVEKSSHKIRVVPFFGGQALGLMDAQSGMFVSRGTAEASGQILAVASGHNTVILGLGYHNAASGRFYPEFLQIASGHAASFGWPNGSDCVKFGHKGGINANGAPNAIGSGMYYQDGTNAVKGFNRVESLT